MPVEKFGRCKIKLHHRLLVIAGEVNQVIEYIEYIMII